MKQKQLNLMGSVSQTGYGVVCYNVLKYLKEINWDVSLFVKGGSDRPTDEERKTITEGMNRSTLFPHDAPCLNIWHQHDLANSIGRGKYFAYPFFELDTFNEIEKHHLSYPDELILSSSWAEAVVRENKITTPVSIVPPGVDLNVFNPNLVPPKNSDKYIFLNCGKWEVRKGHDFLVDSFHQAFNKGDNVELWLMPTNPFLTEQQSKNWEALYMNTPLGQAGKIKILPWQIDHREVAKIMSLADCGIFPSRGEGWNLELLEMMAMGKNVIATNYSAHTEFCTEDNCDLIEIDDLESAYDGKWFHDQGNWAEIGQRQLLQIKERMRFRYDEFVAGRNPPNIEGIETSERFSWEKCAEKLDKALTYTNADVECV